MIARSAAWHTPERPRVARVEPQTDHRWDAFVQEHPDGMVFHHSAWLRVVEETYGFQPVHLAVVTGEGSLLGVLPLFRVHGLITGRGLFSLPRTPVAGPLVLDRQAASMLIEAALGLIDTSRERLDLRLTSTRLDGLAGVSGVPVATAHRLKLPEPGAEVRFGNAARHGKIKNTVERAAREGVEVRAAETEADLRAWYTLYLEAMRFHAAPPRPYRFFSACWRLLRPSGLMSLLIAERWEGGRVRMLAGSFFGMYGETVFYIYNGRREDALPLWPNDAILWRAIHDAHEAGHRVFDLGEAPEGNPGLAFFKSKWGATPEHRYLYRYPHSERGASDSHGSFGRTRQAVKRLWRRLPLRITALVGDFVFSRL